MIQPQPKLEFFPPTKPENGSMQINEIAKALNNLQYSMKPAIKDSENPFFHSKYADLKSIWDAVKASMREHGLSYTQTFEPLITGCSLVTTLMHNSGQWIRSSLPMVTTKQDPQGYGSAISYYRRYSLAAILGVVTEDDDAESAHSRDTISEKQGMFLTMKMKELGWDTTKQKVFLESWHYEKLGQITKTDFNEMLKQVK